MAEVKKVTLDVLENEDDPAEEFTREFPLKTLAGEDTGSVVEIAFRAPTVDECEKFAETRQGKITNKGRLKKLPNDLELAVAAVNACVPMVRNWKKQKLWNLIRRTGGVASDDGMVGTCYDLLGYDREAEALIGEGPTAEDYPSSSSSSSDAGDTGQ